MRWTRGRTVAVAAAGVVVLAGGVVVATAERDPGLPPVPAPASTTPSRSAPSPSPSPSPSPTAKPTDPLTGGKVDGGPVLAVKVENIGLARPQVGLHQADVVFVEQVEGAQTRLLAVYHTRFPDRVGPVRSARSTDVQLLPLFGRPGLVYSGANARVQKKIDDASIVPVQRSTRDRRRVAPHNVFVDLGPIARSQSEVGRARPIGWTFADEPAQGGAPKASRATSKVGHDTFRFDHSRGRYTVRWNGRTYADGDSGALTRCDNVVVMRVHDHPDGNRDVLGAASVQSDTVGSGTATVYRDGRRIEARWRRTAPGKPLTLTGSGGEPIALHPGQTWVTLQG